MNYDQRETGETLGQESVEQVVAHIEQYCAYEKQRIELSNRPQILSRRAELALLWERKEKLEAQIREAPSVGDLRSRRRTARAYWVLAFVLTGAGLYFTKLSFDPFRSATNPYLYCLGIALSVTFLGELFLAVWCKNNDKLHKTVVTAAFVATLSALVLLAIIRGDLLMQKLKQESQAAVVIDDSNSTPPPQNTFYDDASLLLRLTLPLLALGMDLAAGLALREARRFSCVSDVDPIKLSVELDAVHQQIVSVAAEVTWLKHEAAIFEARFWRDFYRSMLTHTTKKAMTKLLIFAFALWLFLPAHAFAQENTNLVILVDLSQSVATRNQHGETPFEKNLKAVGQMLMEAPAGSRVTVLGITDDSFGQPDILLSAKISTDKGYFGEKLASAHQALLQAWQKRSAHLKSDSRHTDILGALLVATQIFKESHSPDNVLVIFSDMRQDSRELNLETTKQWVPQEEIKTLSQKRLVADLQGVEVHALGVDNAGKDLTYWQSLRQFWIKYFEFADAKLYRYSIQRESNGFWSTPISAISILQMRDGPVDHRPMRLGYE
jgi:hypothetical protein